jgi:putative PIG3 family NAD(P)H quinone oxidoreductase
VRAIQVVGQGREAKLQIGEAPDPQPAPGEVRIRVRAASLNQADVIQRRGLYPPPPGASSILGLDCAGTIDALGPDVGGWREGDRVMALLPGGGYAERAVVHAGSLLPIPERLSFEQAAALPEVCLTVFLNLFEIGQLAPGQWALVHGGGSGIGTASIRMGREAGLHVAVTCGSEDKVKRCRELGAEVALNYKDGEFAPALLEQSGGGVDAILDSIGAPYLDQHLRCLRTGGSLILIGLRGGARAEIPLGMLMTKRLRVIGSTLRALPVERKAALTSAFWQRFGAAVEAGRLDPVIDRVLPLEEAQRAHEVLEASQHFGKIVLSVA